MAARGQPARRTAATKPRSEEHASAVVPREAAQLTRTVISVVGRDTRSRGLVPHSRHKLTSKLHRQQRTLSVVLGTPKLGTTISSKYVLARPDVPPTQITVWDILHGSVVHSHVGAAVYVRVCRFAAFAHPWYNTRYRWCVPIPRLSTTTFKLALCQFLVLTVCTT